MKHLITLLVCTFMLACGTVPRNKNFQIPLPSFGSAQEGENDTADYTLRPNDIIDVIYHFDTLVEGTYKIAPHDKVSVKFLNAPEYDDVHQVRPDGFISLPLIDDLKIAGLSVEELKSMLMKRYRPILKEPSFFVSLFEYQVHLNAIRAALDHPNMGQARLITVREDGKISLPLLGDITVSDKPIETIREQVNARYDSIAKGMRIDILLHKRHPRHIYVFGAVQNPGAHPVTTPISLFHAIALAGGPSSEAKMSTIVTLRPSEGELSAQVYDLNAALTGKHNALSAELRPDDIIYVPQTRLNATAQIMRQISDIILFRGIGIGVNASYRINDESEINSNSTGNDAQTQR